jgi:HK97 family phage prohead protease
MIERRVHRETLEPREKRAVAGYAAVFNEETLIGDERWGFREVIMPGAFAQSLDRDVRLLFNHDPNLVLARTANGTLRLVEDRRGLRFEAEVAETQWGEDVLQLVRRGDVDQASFAFEVEEEEWDTSSRPPLRTIKRAKLWDVSVVTFPAYESTSVWARSAVDWGRVMTALNMRGVIPQDVSDRLADEDTPWEAPALSDFTDRSWDELSDAEKRRIAGHYAWSRTMPPETFGDLKLPHHRPSDGAVVWRGVAAAMAALLGARGGVDIPDADRRRVYNHLARHYRQFDREPPEFDSAPSEPLHRIRVRHRLATFARG